MLASHFSVGSSPRCCFWSSYLMYPGRKASEVESSSWATIMHIKDPVGLQAPGFNLDQWWLVIWRVNQWKILSFSLSPFCPPALQSLKWLLKRGTFIDLVPMCQALIHSVSCKPPCNSVRKAGVGQNPWLKVWEQRLGIAVKMHFGKPASHSVVPEREPQLCSQYHLPANAHPEGHKVKSQVLETQHPCSPVFSLGV